MRQLFLEKFQDTILTKEECNLIYDSVKLFTKNEKLTKNVMYDIFYELYFELFLTQNSSNILNRVKEKKFFFFHEQFEDIKKDVEEENNFIEHPPEIKEGIIPCSHCKSSKTISFEKQTRSSDEQATIYVRCLSCKKQTKM